MNIYNDGTEINEKENFNYINFYYAYTEINNRTKWNGKIHIISDEKFFALLTDNEYALYLALKSISYHDNKGNHYLFQDQVNYKRLAKELLLKGNKNKAGENTSISRQSIAKLFMSLINKNILKHGIVREFESKEGYFIINEENYKFIRINNEFLKALTQNIKGQTLKTYIYIKAAFDYSLRNGNRKLFINRQTIAEAINEVNSNGVIGKRQLDNITQYISLLCELNLITTKTITTKKADGKYSACLTVVKVNDELEDTHISKAS